MAQPCLHAEYPIAYAQGCVENSGLLGERGLSFSMGLQYLVAVTNIKPSSTI